MVVPNVSDTNNQSKGRTISVPPTARSDEADAAYRYDNTRPLTVFALALTAAVGAVLLVGAAWTGLDTATQDHDLASPPDLKGVVEKTGVETRRLVEDVKADLADRSARPADAQPAR